MSCRSEPRLDGTWEPYRARRVDALYKICCDCREQHGDGSVSDPPPKLRPDVRKRVDGFRSPEVLTRRWEEDGFLGSDPHYLAVVDGGGNALGLVMWEEGYRGLGGSGVWVIGILLAPEHRGRGIGTTAQRLLAEYLFETTRAHRLLAFTETTNTAEQRALEKCGFQREGVFRQGGFRGGEWRDVLAYGLLRAEFDG